MAKTDEFEELIAEMTKALPLGDPLLGLADMLRIAVVSNYELIRLSSANAEKHGDVEFLLALRVIAETMFEDAVGLAKKHAEAAASSRQSAPSLVPPPRS